MKILAIRGENLASLGKPFTLELDQQPLSGAGLYVITGSTGAGKSTLLDALCLALYDTIPRTTQSTHTATVGHDQLRPSDPRSILRHGTSYGHAEVDFIGKTATPFRATWTVRRARNSMNGRLQPVQMNLKNLKTEEVIGRTKSEILKAIETEVGLSFEQFRRSVLLAQGDFSAFLQANEKERSELLERMTGTEIYTKLSILAHSRASIEAQEMELLRRQRDSLQLLSGEEQLALEKQTKHLQDNLTQQQKQLVQVEKKLAWHSEQQKLEKQEAQAKQDLDRWEKEFQTLKKSAEQLKQVEAAQTLRPTSQTLTVQSKHLVSLSKSLKSWEQQLETTKKKAGDNQQAIKQLEEEYAQLTKAWDEKQPDLKQAKQIDNQLEQAKQQLTSAREQVAHAKTELGVTVKQESTIKEQLELIRQQEQVSLSEQEIHQLRHQLTPGSPCTVCGSTNHPWSDRIESSIHTASKQNTTAVAQAKNTVTTPLLSLHQIEAKAAAISGERKARQLVLDERLLALTKIESNIESFTKTRGSLLNGIATQTIINTFQQSQTKHVKQLDMLHREAAENCKASEIQSKQYEELLAQHKQQNLSVDSLQAQLERELETQNLTLKQLHSLLNKDTHWINKTRQQLDTMRESGGKLKGKLDQCQGQRITHEESRVSHELLKELKSQKATLAQSTSDTQETLFESIAKTKQNKLITIESQKLEKKLAKQKEQSAVWETLRILIGSSDGNKFRRFAQSLTLDTLISYANEHLKEIAPRYRLERIPQTDVDLQVIDREMADEVRSPYSLSGGESFLVSLSLALGLASLSSHHTQIETLFVDEGFGALDPHSLDIVLSALDNLQALGRQIGIISHIPTLIERIGTAIHVKGQGGGGSRLQLIS